MKNPEDAFILPTPSKKFAYLPIGVVDDASTFLSLGEFLSEHNEVEEVLLGKGEPSIPVREWNAGAKAYVGEYFTQWLNQHHQIWVEDSVLVKVAIRAANMAISEGTYNWLLD